VRASGLVCRAVERKPQGFRTISCKLGLRSKRASDSLLLLTVEIELNSFAVALVLCLDASLTRDHIARLVKHDRMLCINEGRSSCSFWV
jgi:hypothetical protein